MQYCWMKCAVYVWDEVCLQAVASDNEAILLCIYCMIAEYVRVYQIKWSI